MSREKDEKEKAAPRTREGSPEEARAAYEESRRRHGGVYDALSRK